MNDLLMKSALVSLLLICFAAALQAEEPAPRPDGGQLFMVKLDTAPFPHPDRASGHTYNGKLYSAAEHYSDNTVGFFVPRGFHPNGKIDFVIHFHGWFNHVENVFSHYELPAQFIAGNRNAILIVPEGPKDAPDSFDGKLEDPEGFKRFMADVMKVLREKKIIGDDQTGGIILSGHSGGYEVISSILAQGGLTDHIREVWLFDALYGRTEKFTKWFYNRPDARMLNIYTEHGGTKKETENLMADMKLKGTPFLSKPEEEITEADLRGRQMIFTYTKLEHDEVMQKHHTFAQYLKTCCLSAIK